MALESISKALGTWRSTGLSDYISTSCLLALPFLLTYTLTYIKAYWIKSTNIKHGAREPPPAPYAAPLLGNTIAFANDPQGTLRKML